MRPHVRTVWALALTITLGACASGAGGEAGPAPASPSGSPSKTGASPTGTPSRTPSEGPTSIATPTAEPVLDLPDDAPTTFQGAVSQEGPFRDLLPPGAEILDARFLEPTEASGALAGLAWARGDDPFARELGFVMWERFPNEWQATFAFTDGPASGVLGVSLDVADVTRDGVEDALTFEDIGGSGACGIWRVIAPVHGSALQALRRRTCDAQLSIVGDHLELREAVFEPGDSHCCPSAFRTTTLEWDGSAFVETDVRESPAPAP